MVFSSYVFLFLFLPVTLLVYYAIPSRALSARNVWLLLASLFFYSWNEPRYLLILLASILLNWLSGVLLSPEAKHRRAVLTASVLLNVALLVYFKYANFLVKNLTPLFPALGRGWRSVALPLGISFFTFQGLSYVIDVYRGDVEVLRSPLEVGVYISMFPQLVAGPIVRSKQIVGELHARAITLSDMGYGFRRFVYGLAKKVLLADTFGMIADGIFPDLAAWNTGSAWIGILAYTLQIYYDFSGYSDMAIGMGSMLGFHFSENFRYPYAADSVTDFWRRWHISLSSWFRDYVYIPCGGSRVSRGRYVFNVMLVWLLTGIWHGANWTFICWGVYYGILLLLERLVFAGALQRTPRLLRRVMTLLFVMVGWVLFRSDSPALALLYLREMLSFPLTAASVTAFMRYAVNYAFFWVVGVIGVFPVKRLFARLPSGGALRAAAENLYVLGLFALSVLYLISGSYNAFIYFQF